MVGTVGLVRTNGITRKDSLLMLRMVELKRAPQDEDLYCPVFICDACGEMITDSSWGLFAWVVDLTTGAPLTGRVHTVHKRACDHTLEAEAQAAGYGWYTMELRLLSEQIAANLKPGPDATKLAAEWTKHKGSSRPSVLLATVQE